MDEKFKKQVDAAEAEGRQRFGEETWTTLMGAVRRACPNGISEGDMQQLLQTGNATNLLAVAGRTRLMDEASNGDADAERTYSKMRAEERRIWREARGRR